MVLRNGVHSVGGDPVLRLVAREGINVVVADTAMSIPGDGIAQRRQVVRMKAHRGIESVVIALRRVDRFGGPKLLGRLAKQLQRATDTVLLHHGFYRKRPAEGTYAES